MLDVVLFFLDWWRKLYPSSMADSKGKQKHNIAWIVSRFHMSQNTSTMTQRHEPKSSPARQVIFILLGAVSRLNSSCLGSPNRALDGEFSGSWTRSQYQAKLMLFIFMDWFAGLFTDVEFWISQAFGGYSLKTQLGQRGVLKRGSNPVGVMDGLRKHCCLVLGFGRRTSYTWIPRLPIFFGRHVCVPCFTSSPNTFLFPETQNTTLPRFPSRSCTRSVDLWHHGLWTLDKRLYFSNDGLGRYFPLVWSQCCKGSWDIMTYRILKGNSPLRSVTSPFLGPLRSCMDSWKSIWFQPGRIHEFSMIEVLDVCITHWIRLNAVYLLCPPVKWFAKGILHCFDHCTST